MTLSHAYPRTANDRLKDSFQVRLALSFMVAVALHTVVFRMWPAVQVEPLGIPDELMDVVRISDFELPPAPEPIARPALPVPTATDAVAQDVPPVIGWREVAELPPPTAAAEAGGEGTAVPFTPYQVAPSLLNPEEVQRTLAREYPPLLRDTGVGGTVQLLVHIDAVGAVLEARVDGTSGVASLDAAALRVADAFRFRPALNRDRAVEVWIRLPVTFMVR